jgi:hypothetical protein
LGITMFAFTGHLLGRACDGPPDEEHQINALVDATAACARRCSQGYRECSTR